MTLVEKNSTNPEEETSNKKRFINIVHNPVTAWIILVASLVLTMGAYFLSVSFVQKRTEDRFSFRTHEIEQAIKDRLRIYEQTLWGGVGFMNSTKNRVSRKQWTKYVETVKINQHWPGIQGIGFSIPLQPEEKQTHIESIRSEGFPDYFIKPEGERDFYSAIIYLEPFDWRNQRAFGYDMWSNEMRRMAMMRARDEGVAATSGIITLVQETEEDIQRGFLTYLPLYQTNTIPKTIKERREQFVGWVYAPFRAKDLMKGILGTKDPNIEFEIFDGELISRESLLFDSNQQLHLEEPHHNPDWQKTVKITLQGRLWTLYFNTPKNFLGSPEKNQPRYVALVGGFVDLLLFYVIYALYFINRRAEAIAREMTQESREANDELIVINEDLKKTTFSRDYMDSVLQSIIDTLIVVNPDATIRMANPATFALLGYEEKELLGQSIGKLFGEEEFPENGFEDLVQRLETTFVTKGGGEIPVLFSSSAMKDKDGKTQGFVCVAQNLTEHKLKDEALRNINKRLKISIEKMPNAYMSFDRDLHIVDWNKEAEKIFGYSKKEMLGKNPVNYIVPEPDRNLVLDVLKKLQIGKVASFSEKDNNIRKDGKLISCQWFNTPLVDDHGDVLGILSLAQDITKRMQDEAALHQYAHIVSSSTDMLALLNKEYIFNAANTAYLQRFKLTSEQLIGYSVSDVFGEEFFNTVMKPNADQCLAGEEVNYQAWFDFPKIGERYMDITYYPYIGDEKKVLGFVVSGRDVTEQYEVEEELFKAKKLESIGVLAGGIAHGFNNILTGLFGNIELAKLKLPQEHAAYTYIETAHQALDRASDLTKQLLTFAKGGDPLLEAVDLKQVIKDSIEFNLSGSNIKAVLNLSDNLWQGKVDKGQVSQVVANLAINAKQAMPDGGILTIDAENIKDIEKYAVPRLSGNYVKIRIRDEGVGISDKHLEKIFDPYFTTKQTGSGLGLATVHSIVAKHDGHISIDSKLGVGTTFTLYLPADISSRKTIDTIPPSVAENSQSTLGHILVMDDEAMIRNLSTKMLESCGHTVDYAADGKEALEKYIAASKSDNPFDIVIMDLTIPGGMGGKEAINELCAVDPKAKAIVSSGYSTDTIMANYSDYGFKGRLAKPFKMGDMKKEISRVMALG